MNNKKINIWAILITIIVHSLFFIILYFYQVTKYIFYTKKNIELVVVHQITDHSKYDKGRKTRAQQKLSNSQLESTSIKKIRSSKRNYLQNDPLKEEKVVQRSMSPVSENKKRDSLLKIRQKDIFENVSIAFDRNKKNKGFANVNGIEKYRNNEQNNNVGNGSSYSLDGRNIIGNGGVPIRPQTQKAIYGSIIVGILVNANGEVTDAWIEPRGSQISDPDVRNSAKEAAKKTKFNAITTSSNSQKGYIIYKFTIK